MGLVEMKDTEQYRRWRLILGKDSEEASKQSSGQGSKQGNASPSNQRNKDENSKVGSPCLTEIDKQRDELLNHLYRNEGKGRGQRTGKRDEQTEEWENEDVFSFLRQLIGGQEPSVIKATEWLHKVRKVFPQSTVEVLQQHAIERYDMKGLLTDKEVLKQSEPNIDLVKTLLNFRAHLTPGVMTEVRRIIRIVCDELEKRLAQKIKSRFASRRVRHQHGGRKLFANLDWSTSIRRNLKHYQPESDEFILERLYFFSRNQQKVPWHFYILVDQSGSMAESVIHSAVMASVFFQIKSLHTRLILFDTSIVDVTSDIQDPVETLLAVQLGGGTDIGNAVAYASTQIAQPSRTLLVLISDFAEGGDESFLYSKTQYLSDSGVRMLGLAALDSGANPWYDQRIAGKLAKMGMPIAAMTPDHLADWVADNMRSF